MTASQVLFFWLNPTWYGTQTQTWVCSLSVLHSASTLTTSLQLASSFIHSKNMLHHNIIKMLRYLQQKLHLICGLVTKQCLKDIGTVFLQFNKPWAVVKLLAVVQLFWHILTPAMVTACDYAALQRENTQTTWSESDFVLTWSSFLNLQ